MCWKRTFREVAGKRIVCYENIACFTIPGPALGYLAVSGVKRMIFKNINNLHLTRLHLNEPVCVLIPEGIVIADNVTWVGDVPKDYMGDTYLSWHTRVRRHASLGPFYSGRRPSHFQVNFPRHSYKITTRQVPSGTICPPAVVHG